MTAVHVSPLVKRYASALLDVADDKNAASEVEKDMDSLAVMLDSSEDFVSLVQSPAIDNAEQNNAINAISKKAKFHKLTTNFLNVLVHNNRLNLLAQVISAFQQELLTRKGFVSAMVTLASAPSAAQTKSITVTLEKMTKQKIVLDTVVDPSILGGMIVRIGSLMVDDSTKKKLEQLNIAMGGSGQVDVISQAKAA